MRNERNATTGIVASSKHFFFFIVFLPTFLFAGHLTIRGSVGALFDSNIEHLSIVDFLTMGKRYGFFFRNTASADYGFGPGDNLIAGLSLLSETGLDVPEKSRFQETGVLGWHLDLREDLSLDLSLLIHHASENYLRLRNMFLDLFGSADLFWDMSDRHSLYSTTRVGYFIGFDEEMRYLTGPAIAFEGGYWHYPTEYTDHVKIGLGLEGYFFRPEVLSSCTDTLTISNRSVKTYAFIEGKVDLAPVFLKASVRYAYFAWLENDRFNEWSKRRQEHIPSLGAQVLWRITKNFDLALSYTYRHIFSNFGKDPEDYVNYTMDRHTLLLEMTARYEGETP